MGRVINTFNTLECLRLIDNKAFIRKTGKFEQAMIKTNNGVYLVTFNEDFKFVDKELLTLTNFILNIKWDLCSDKEYVLIPKRIY